MGGGRPPRRLHTRARVGRDVRRSRRAAFALPVAAPGPRHALARRLRAALRGSRPRLPRPGHHLLPLRRGAAVPPRPRAADHRRRRVGGGRVRRAPAGARARAVPRRRLRARRDPGRRRGAAPAGGELVALPPLRRRARPRRRRARARRRGRPRARRRRQLPGARGQPAHAVGHLVRGREPPGDDPRVPGAVRQPSHPPRRRLPAAAARGVPRHRAAGRRRPVRRRPHARHPQRRVLRALVPRPPDGRRAGRGPRPRVPRPARLHAHDRG